MADRTLHSPSRRRILNPNRYEPHKRLLEYIVRFHFGQAQDPPHKLSEALNLDIRLVHKIIEGYRKRQNLLRRLAVPTKAAAPPCTVEGCKRHHLIHRACYKCGSTFFKGNLCRKHYFNYPPPTKVRCTSFFGKTPCPHFARSKRSGLCQTHYDRRIKGRELTKSHRSDKTLFCGEEVVSISGIRQCGLRVKENKGRLCIGHAHRQNRGQPMYIPIGKLPRRYHKSEPGTCEVWVLTPNDTFTYCGRKRRPRSTLCRGHRERRTKKQPMYISVGARVPIYCAEMVEENGERHACGRLVRETTRRNPDIQRLCHGHLQRKLKGQPMHIPIGQARKPKRVA